MRIDPGTQMEMMQMQRASGSLSRVAEDSGVKEDKALKDACAGFEAVLLHTLMKTMRQTLPEGGIFDRSNAMDIWESQYDQEVTDRIAKGPNNTGIGDVLYRQLSPKFPSF